MLHLTSPVYIADVLIEILSVYKFMNLFICQTSWMLIQID